MNCMRRALPVLCYDELNPQARSVIMLVHLLNANVEMRPIELFRGDQFADGYELLNPAQTVPVLVHNGVILTDSHTILMYICEKLGGRYGQLLFPSNCYIKRLQIVDKLFFESSILHRRHSEFMTEIIRKTYANTDVVFHEKRILNAYAMLDSYLGNCAFIVGHSLTIADLAIVATASALDIMFPIENGQGKWPNLCDWFRRMRALPVYLFNCNGILKQREIIETFGGFEFPAPNSQNMQSARFSWFPPQCVSQPQCVPQYLGNCSVQIEEVEVEPAEINNPIRKSSTVSIKELEEIRQSLGSMKLLDQTRRSSSGPTKELNQMRKSTTSVKEQDQGRGSNVNQSKGKTQSKQKKYQDYERKASSAHETREKAQSISKRNTLVFNEVKEQLLSIPRRNTSVNDAREKSQITQKRNTFANEAREKSQIIQKRNTFANEGREKSQIIPKRKSSLNETKSLDNQKRKSSYNGQGNEKSFVKAETLTIEKNDEKIDMETKGKSSLEEINAAQQSHSVCSCGPCSSCRTASQNVTNVSENINSARVSCMIKQFEEKIDNIWQPCLVNCCKGAQNQNRRCHQSWCNGNANAEWNTYPNANLQRMPCIIPKYEAKSAENVKQPQKLLMKDNQATEETVPS